MWGERHRIFHFFWRWFQHSDQEANATVHWKSYYLDNTTDGGIIVERSREGMCVNTRQCVLMWVCACVQMVPFDFYRPLQHLDHNDFWVSIKQTNLYLCALDNWTGRLKHHVHQHNPRLMATSCLFFDQHLTHLQVLALRKPPNKTTPPWKPCGSVWVCCMSGYTIYKKGSSRR